MCNIINFQPILEKIQAEARLNHINKMTVDDAVSTIGGTATGLAIASAFSEGCLSLMCQDGMR